MTKRLKPEVKVRRQWIRALRSGKYKQTTNKLRGCEGFCCLGVLCDLAVKAKVIPEPRVLSSDKYSYEDNTFFLPEKVQRWAGLKTSDADFKSNGLSSNLPTLNDIKSNTFEQIANVIESNPKGLFEEENA
jgi:hypothetical protein